mmetsp:Transcript_4614/g.13589  ORF Transcript_4614/g.13589 Transcript_4614/m.13589 type:complete len:217 (-) Transcript_4614:1432-2082(-)
MSHTMGSANCLSGDPCSMSACSGGSTPLMAASSCREREILQSRYSALTQTLRISAQLDMACACACVSLSIATSVGTALARCSASMWEASPMQRCLMQRSSLSTTSGPNSCGRSTTRIKPGSTSRVAICAFTTVSAHEKSKKISDARSAWPGCFALISCSACISSSSTPSSTKVRQRSLRGECPFMSSTDFIASIEKRTSSCDSAGESSSRTSAGRP